jgi:hypothetical protein
MVRSMGRSRRAERARSLRLRCFLALAGASLLPVLASAQAETAAEPIRPVADPISVRLLALDLDAQRVVIAGEATEPAVVAAGEAVAALPGFHLRRVLADRAVLEKPAADGVERQQLWVFPLGLGETRSRVQELLAVPPPESLAVQPRPAPVETAAKPGAGDQIRTVEPPSAASEPPP